MLASVHGVFATLLFSGSVTSKWSFIYSQTCFKLPYVWDHNWSL